MAQAMLMKRGAGVNGLPKFTYTGEYQLVAEEDNNWLIRFLTSGTLQFLRDTVSLDVFLVGGGGGGGLYCGAGGGFTRTEQVVAEREVSYPIVVGAGGARQSTGGASIAFGFNCAGGNTPGGSGSASNATGGSGGGGWGGTDKTGGVGGTDGGAGGFGGAGQGTTTREFGEASGVLYSGGGGGGGAHLSKSGGAGGNGGGGHGATIATAGVVNTGGGGGSGNNYDGSGAVGGSGIVVIRNHREA